MAIKREVWLAYSDAERIQLEPLLSVEGLSLASAECFTSSGYLQDGVHFGPGRYLSRSVTIQFDVEKQTPENCRAFLQRLSGLVGNREVTLEILENDPALGRTSRYYLSPCRVLNPYNPTIQGRTIRTVALQLTAADPYIKKEVSPQVLDQEDSRKIYRNDYLWYPNDALVLSQNRTEVLVYNGGDADTPVEIRFYGPASQPYIENLTTGEKVGITSNLETGEYMDVYTAYGKKRVTIVDTDGAEHNAYHYLQQGSIFPMLHPGENRLRYGSAAQDGTIGAGLEVRYYERYAGYAF